MLVLEDAKALALKLGNPNRVLEAVPTAITLRPGVVIVPHAVQECRALSRLGIAAPSPINHYYDWPGRYKPYLHQRETAAFLTMHKRALVLNDIGTGKTHAALWAADYLMKQGVINKALVVSPLSTLERVWGDSVFCDFPHRKALVLHGSAARRKRLLVQPADFYVVNHDGFPIIAKDIHGAVDLVIVDEAAVLRNATTQRFKHFLRWMSNNPDVHLWLMTGTPTPNEPTDAWALARLVDSPNCRMPWTRFRELVMFKAGMYKWLPRPESAEIVSNVLVPAIRYTRDECVELPDTVTQTREVTLTTEQQHYYDKMMRHLIAEVATGGNTITAVNEAVKLAKLVQISCGVAYDDDGQYVELDCAPRVALVREVIEETTDKVIVFVPLTGTLRLLQRELEKHYTVGVVNGAVKANDRNMIFHNFQSQTDPRVLIAHPATMAHGLTLTAASTIIWYGPITSNEQYVQANGRIERIGKRHVSNVIHIEATALERRMFQRLQEKQSLQGLLLDLIQEVSNR